MEAYNTDNSPLSSPITQRNSSITALNINDCLEFLVKFVENNDLTKIVLGSDIKYDSKVHRNELKEKLRPQAAIAAELPDRMKFVNREFITNFAILSLYDLAVLVDDSQSMAFDEQGERIKALKAVLSYLAYLYDLASPDRGIRAIRFLNGNDDLDANNLKSDQVGKIIEDHEFEGLTKIGTSLMRKILKPLVFADERWDKASRKPRKLRELQRPLLIMVITDGAVEGELSGRLPQAINSVYDSLRAAGYSIDTKAVVFQFARVGNDKEAKKYLDFLDNHSKVKDLVDTMSGSDLMDVIGWRDDYKKDSKQKMTENQQRTIIKLLLGPISARFDGDIENKEEDSSEDFEEEEEEEDEWEAYKKATAPEDDEE